MTDVALGYRRRKGRMTNWVIQRLGDRWAAGYVDGNNGFHVKFNTHDEAYKQATWNRQEGDTITYWDERGQPLPVIEIPGLT